MCTYENWSASAKCTLCRTPRSSSLIEEEMQRLNVSSNEPGDIAESHASVSTDPSHSIRCSSCTYLNKPTSFKCEQCFQVFRDPQELRRLSSKITPSASIEHQASPSPPPVAEKWPCPQCTYENWPKSKHCVMCYGPHPLIPLDSHSDVTEDTEGRDKNSMQTHLISPGQTRAKRPKMTCRDKLWLDACRAVLDGEVTPIERYLLVGGRLDRKLTKQDCRHLENLHHPLLSNDILRNSLLFDTACWVLEHEVTCPSSRPVSASGLFPNTDESVSATSYPKFRLGSTLVDLAIRFGRTDLINLFIALSGLQTATSTLSIPGNGSARDTSRSSLANCLSSEALSQSKVFRRPSSGQTHSSLQQCVSRAYNLTNRSKWMPCQASPHVARELRDLFAASIKHNQGGFACAYLAEWGTFALPHSITKLPSPVKYLLLSELCDTQVQTELEDEARAINWWFMPGQKQASRLFALWNRTAGDCLLDSVLQACWGVFDRENVLRRALADSLRRCEDNFYPRWREYEALQAACHYILDENQCRRDWDNVLSAANQPGGALEQIHIFALCHILRRPILVYGVKYIKNYRDEPIGIANFQGIYIPLLWDPSFCCPNPIVLGYTRGHFSALVPMEPQPTVGPLNVDSPLDVGFRAAPLASPRSPPESSSRKHSPTPADEIRGGSVGVQLAVSHSLCVTESLLTSYSMAGAPHQSSVYLPLVDRQGVMLPIHFTTAKEAIQSHNLLRDWLDVVSTKRGLSLARLRLHPRHPLVDCMLDDWLASYRSLANFSATQLTGAAGVSAGQRTLEGGRSIPTSTDSSAPTSTSSSSTSLSIASEQCSRSAPRETDGQHDQSS